ncbi:MAG: DUF5686 family protein, partial [Bacteroidales bacterium]
MKRLILFSAIVISSLMLSVGAMGQSKSVRIQGMVRDSVSMEVLPFTAITFEGTTIGVLANDGGAFEIISNGEYNKLSVSTMGYVTKLVEFDPTRDNIIVVDLVAEGVALNEVLVKPKRENYSKKNNPAVDFVKKLMAQKGENDPKDNDYYSYNKYNKITLGINNFSEENRDKALFKKFQFIFDYLDTSEVSGKPILNLSVKEEISDVYFSENGKVEKEVVTGLRSNGIDEMLDQDGVKDFLEDVFREIDIFEKNDITLLQNRFVSPLSDRGVNFYKYYLTDTIMVDGEECIELGFVPFTPETFGFLGRVYVPLNDTTLFIKRVKLDVPKSINLNYVQNMVVEQDYIKGVDGSRIKVKDDMVVEFGILNSQQGGYARRYTSYKNHSYDAPKDMSVFNIDGNKKIDDLAERQPDEYWGDNRHVEIKKSESSMEKLLHELREVPIFYWSETILKILVSGYIQPYGEDSMFDIGPMNTTISGNAVEGVRLRAGGMTTANLSPNWFGRGYVAYGTEDGIFKYSGEVEYSFLDKKVHAREFPINALKLSYKYDVDQLGQQYLFTNKDNVFLALKRTADDKMSYLREGRLQYQYERLSGFSVVAGASHQIQYATTSMPFVDGNGVNFNNYTQAAFDVTLRYAPGEKFYQSRSNRFPINQDNPIFVLKHTYSPKGFMNSMFEINKTEFSVQKRFWLSVYGYIDAIAKVGKVWSEVSYPNLFLGVRS